MTDSAKTPRRRIVGTKAIPQDSEINDLRSDISTIMSDIAEIKDSITAIQYELHQLRAELEESDDGN